MTTVREIAEFAGVSKSTVSLVLNNKAGVSDEMRQTVLNAVNELENIHAEEILPEQLSRSHPTENKVNNLSIMVLHPPVLRSSYVFSEVLQGIQSAAETFNVQLCLMANDPNATAQHISHLYLSDDNLRPDGVLVFGAQQDEPLLKKVIAQRLPCVVLGREVQKYPVSGIERNEQRYAYQLTQHLLELGHRSIAFVGGEMIYDYTNNRLKGYQHALEDAGIVMRDEWICLGNGTQATEAILECTPEVTAIVYVNDSYADEGLTSLRARGLQVPDDISVVSFDNTETAQSYSPPLTSIAYNRFKEGQWAVKMLIDHIRNPFIEKSHLVFKAELIVRESSAAPSQKQ